MYEEECDDKDNWTVKEFKKFWKKYGDSIKETRERIKKSNDQTEAFSKLLRERPEDIKKMAMAMGEVMDQWKKKREKERGKDKDE